MPILYLPTEIFSDQIDIENNRKMTLSKQDAVNMQNKVDSKKGSALCFKGSIATIKPKEKGKAKSSKKDALEGIKSNNWIGSEDDFQIAVAKLLDSHGLDWFHCPNGGKRHVSVATKLKKMGVKAGIPDVIILNPTIVNGHVGICIELKVGSNTSKESQMKWHDKFLIHNWGVFICYSIDEVDKIVKRYYEK